jgi:hypothetical protein
MSGSRGEENGAEEMRQILICLCTPFTSFICLSVLLHVQTNIISSGDHAFLRPVTPIDFHYSIHIPFEPSSLGKFSII